MAVGLRYLWTKCPSFCQYNQVSLVHPCNTVNQSSPNGRYSQINQIHWCDKYKGSYRAPTWYCSTISYPTDKHPTAQITVQAHSKVPAFSFNAPPQWWHTIWFWRDMVQNICVAWADFAGNTAQYTHLQCCCLATAMQHKKITNAPSHICKKYSNKCTKIIYKYIYCLNKSYYTIFLRLFIIILLLQLIQSVILWITKVLSVLLLFIIKIY